MILNFGDYIYDDGVRGIDGTKPKMVDARTPKLSISEQVKLAAQRANDIRTGTQTASDPYEQYKFNEGYYHNLLNKGKLRDALDYITKYRPIDEEKRKIFDADVASLRQQAKYDNNFKSKLDDDQLNRYNFYENVFSDGGFDYMQDNPYVQQFKDLKRKLGSIEGKEATGLSFYFPQTKRYDSVFGITLDSLAHDSHNGIDDFLQYSNVTKAQLEDAGVTFTYNDDGSTNMSFSKANGIANSLIYNYIKFYKGQWYEGTGIDPKETFRRPRISGLDSDNNVISTNIVPFDGENGHTMGRNFIKRITGDYIPTNSDIANKLDFDAFYKLIEDNKTISETLETVHNAKTREYSSIESNFVSDAMQNYLNDAKANGYTQEQILKGMKYIHDADVERVTKSISKPGNEFYTNYFNPEFDKGDDSLSKTEDPEEIRTLMNKLQAADPNDVNLTILVSNGIIGTKISIAGDEGKKGDDSSKKRGVQIWIPGLFTEEAQRRLNEHPESRSVLEVNTILDTSGSYTLNDGSRISSDGVNLYMESGRVDLRGANRETATYRRREAISKEQATGYITKDLMIESAIQSQFAEQIAPSGKIINVDDYTAAAKVKALTVAQQLYKGVDDLVKTDGTLITAEEIFNKKINQNNVSPYVYNKVKAIYDVYDALMRELYSYEDFQDALLELGKVRYDYSANS